MIRITLWHPTPSQNEIQSMLYTFGGRKKLTRLKTGWKTEIWALLNSDSDYVKWRNSKDRGYFRKIKFKRYGRNMLDPTNLVGGVKYHLDIFTQLDVIKDDRQQDVIVVCEQEIDRKNPRTEIILEEVR